MSLISFHVIFSIRLTTPTDKVLGITDPESTSAIGLVEPLVQAFVKKCTMQFADGNFWCMRSTVPTDVRVNSTSFDAGVIHTGVLDFSAKFQSIFLSNLKDLKFTNK